MQLLFQNPLWLLGALALAPLIAHLFSRARPRRREFPSVLLLREALRRITRVRRPRDRWLLILRTLAMAALALAFLQPLLLSRFASRTGAAKTAVLVIDLSASMAYADGTRTRLAQAVTAAEEWLGTLPGNSRANIVWAQAHPLSALPEPGPNLDYLRQALRQAGVRAEAADSSGALALAARQLAAAGGERELAVFSDFQKSGWRETRWELPPGVRLTRVAVGQEDAGNLGLAGLAVEPARPVAGREARLVCRVRNLSGEPHRVTVFAEAGESRLSQAVELAPWSETLAVMPVTFPAAGLVPLKATLSEDRFPGDDVRYALAEVRGALQVGIAGPEEDATARTWARAAAALDGVAVRRLAALSADRTAGVDVLFVAAWNGENADALSTHLRDGGALVLQPASGMDAAAAGQWLGAPGDGAEDLLGVEDRAAPGWSLRVAHEEHPLFALFAGGAFGDPAAARFTRRASSPAFLKTRPLLAFDDGRPALALLDFDTGAGRKAPVAWWNLDLGATDWASRTVFVPLFGELLAHLAQRTGAARLRESDPGERLRFDAGAALESRDVQLVDEGEHALSVAAESPRAPHRLASEAEPPPGAYRWLAQGSVLDRAVINFPEAESDLRRLTPAELEDAAGAVIHDAGRARMAALREGRPLWPWLLGAAALFLLVEGVLARSIASRSEAAILPQPGAA